MPRSPSRPPSYLWTAATCSQANALNPSPTHRMLGPKLCGRISALLGCLLCILILWGAIPVVFGNVVTTGIMG